MEAVVDAEMDLNPIGFEPAATPLGKVRRLGRFRKAQHVSIERSCTLLLAGGHRELDVVDTDNWHLVCAPILLLSLELKLQAPVSRATGRASASGRPPRAPNVDPIRRPGINLRLGV